MNIKISSVHFDADKKLLDFIQSKVSKTTQYFDGIVGAEVTLKVENASNEENKIAEIKLEVPGNDLFARKQCKTFEESIDTALDALKKQILKHKEKLKGI